MNLIKNAFIIKKIAHQESNEIITAICDEGIIQFIAKGIKKQNSKNQFACQIGSYVTIDLIEKQQLHILKQATLIQTSMQKDYIELLITQLICDIAYQSMYANYEIIKNMQRMKKYHKLLYFLYNLLKENGIILQVERCVRTNQLNTIALSLKDGGLVSQKAMQIQDCLLTKQQLIILKVLDRVKKETIEKYNQLDVDYFLNKQYLLLLTQHLGITSKIQRYIEEEQ